MSSSDNNTSGASKILLAFFGGIAAGIAAGYYLNSEQGRHWRAETASKISDLESQLEEKVKNTYAAARERFNSASSEASEKVSDKVRNVSEKVNNVTDKANV